jgi:RNA polymerase sigma factor (sigma-70 family)
LTAKFAELSVAIAATEGGGIFDPRVTGLQRWETTDVTDDPALDSDASLIRATREGVPDAFGALWQRHHAAAIGLARSLAPACAEDLAADAFARVLRAIRSGAGPVDAFRPYLLATVRTRFVDHYRAEQHTFACADDSTFDRVVTSQPDEHDADSPPDRARQAWSSLTSREQWVIWATVVAGYSNTEVAAQLGVKPTTAAVWLHRSRERLRFAYLTNQLEPATDAVCQSYRNRFASCLRGTLSQRSHDRLLDHLDACGACRTAYAGLDGLNRRMPAMIWPALVASGFVAPRLPWLAKVQLGAWHAASQVGAAKGVAVAASVAVAAGGVTIAYFPHISPRSVVAEPPHVIATRLPERRASIPVHIHVTRRPAPARTTAPARLAHIQPRRTQAAVAIPTPTPTPAKTPTPPTRTSTPSPTATPVATPPPTTTSAARRSGAATFAVPVDPSQVSGTVTVTLPAGWTVTGIAIDGLSSPGQVSTAFDGSNAITIDITRAQAAQPDFTLVISGAGPAAAAVTATAQEAFSGQANATDTEQVS